MIVAAPGLLIFALIVLLAALHPYVTYPVSLMLLRRRPSRMSADGPVRSVAVCMSAFNEERVIVPKIESLLEMARRYGPASLHVYVDGAADRTAELLAPYADRIDLVVSSQRRGKTAGLNLLVARSSSDILVFTDANVVTPPDALETVIAAFADPDVGCASARLVYVNPSDSGMSAAGAGYWRLEENLKALESRTIGLVGVDGAFFAVERSSYSPAPEDLCDDLWVSLCVLCARRHVVSLPQLQVAERNAVDWREEFGRKVRIACQSFNIHKRLWPRLRRLPAPQLYGYVSHRLLKWLSPFLLLIAGAAILAWACLQFGSRPVLIVVGAGAITGAIAAFAGLRIARLGVAAVVSLVGVATGVFQSAILGKVYQVWTPAASIRDQFTGEAR